MLRQKRHRRALWAVAFAAAPIGAHAGALAPGASCNAQGELSTISWGVDPILTGNGSVIGATVSSTSWDLTQLMNPAGGSAPNLQEGSASAQTATVPFHCTFDLVGLMGDGGAPAPGSDVFATASLSSGSAFAIDFGPFNGNAIAKTKDVVDLTPAFTAASYTLSAAGPGALKGNPSSQTVVTDFNLYLDASSPQTQQPLYQDYLGVQVISSASALSGSDRFFVGSLNGNKGSRLIFDPSFSGSATVNLLTSPDPALTGAPSSVPEPGTLALLGAGFIGLLGAVLRRRKRSDDGGSGA